MRAIRHRVSRWVLVCLLIFAGAVLAAILGSPTLKLPSTNPASAKLPSFASRSNTTQPSARPQTTKASSSVSASDATFPNPSFYDAIWVGGTNGLTKVRADDGSLLFNIGGIGNVYAVAVDDINNNVWAFTDGQLRSYDFDGNPGGTLSIAPRPPLLPSVLPTNPLPEDYVDADDLEDTYCAVNGVLPSQISPNALWPLAKLAASPTDGTVWVGMGDHLLKIGPNVIPQIATQKGKPQLAASITILNDITTPGLITGLSVDSNRSRVWVSTCSQTLAYEIDGTSAKQISTGSLTTWQKDVSFDPTAKYLWLGFRGLHQSFGELQRYSENGDLQQIRTTSFPVQHLAQDRHGSVWLSADSILSYVNPEGTVVKTAHPFANDGGIALAGQRLTPLGKECFGIDALATDPPTSKNCNVVALAAHPKKQYAVAAIQSVISEVGNDGNVMLRIPLTSIGGTTTDKMRSLGIYTDLIPPTISIDGPRVGVETGGILHPNPCYYLEGPAQFCVDISYSDIGIGVDASSMTLTINGAAYDPTQCTFRSDGVHCEIPHEDGPISLVAAVSDFAGNVSTTAKLDFILDNFLPQVLFDSFTAITNKPQLTLSGSISEIGTLTLNGTSISLTSGRRFSVGPYTLKEGNNHYDFVVTDTAANVVDNPIDVVLDTIPPQINVSNPGRGFITNQRAIAISGSLNEPATLTVNDASVVVDGSNQFVSGLISLNEGQNVIQLIAIDLAGNTTTSTLTGTLDTVPPVAPTANKITTSGSGSQFTVNGAVGSVEGGSRVTVVDTTTQTQNIVTANADGSFSATLNGHKGDGLQIYSTDAAGNQGTTTNVAGGPFSTPIVLGAVSPADGTTVNGEVVLVSVGLQAPPNTGVTINGVMAVAAQDSTGVQYYANVPLQIGSNALTITATAQDGRVVSQNITIGSTGPQPFEVIATPAIEVGPVQVRFQVKTVANNVGIQEIKVDFNNTGTIGFDTTNPTAVISHTYTGVGLQQAAVTIIDTVGMARTVLVPIVLLDPRQIDQSVQAIWSAMNNALIAGDVNTALSFVSNAAQGTYAPIFNTLLPQMPQIVGSYSTLQRSLAKRAYAEYGINRQINGVDRVFLIGFIRDQNGLWQMDSM